MARRPKGLTQEQKRLFRAAMIYLGYTRESWAAYHEISTGYLDQVRGGFQQNERVVEQICDTIRTFRRLVAEDYIKEHPSICRAKSGA